MVGAGKTDRVRPTDDAVAVERGERELRHAAEPCARGNAATAESAHEVAVLAEREVTERQRDGAAVDREQIVGEVELRRIILALTETQRLLAVRDAHEVGLRAHRPAGADVERLESRVEGEVLVVFARLRRRRRIVAFRDLALVVERQARRQLDLLEAAGREHAQGVPPDLTPLIVGRHDVHREVVLAGWQGHSPWAVDESSTVGHEERRVVRVTDQNRDAAGARRERCAERQLDGLARRDPADAVEARRHGHAVLRRDGRRREQQRGCLLRRAAEPAGVMRCVHRLESSWVHRFVGSRIGCERRPPSWPA